MAKILVYAIAVAVSMLLAWLFDFDLITAIIVGALLSIPTGIAAHLVDRRKGGA